MAANSRESRRRKILERGSDRLAFITGRIPPSQLNLQPTTTTTDSSQPSIPAHRPNLPDQTTVSSDVEEKEISHMSSSVLPEKVSAVDSVHTVTGGGSIEQPSVGVNGGERSASDSLINQNTSVNVDLNPRVSFQRSIFNPIRIKSALVATQTMRLICSVAVAVLVVLFSVGFPLLGSNIVVKSIVNSGPLYLVLLTNFSVVVWRLLGDDKLGGPESGGRRGRGLLTLLAGNGNGSDLLETGLVMQKVIDAFFIDCSVYAMITICGLSFANLVS